jgi:hypothetical protein
MSDAIHSPTLLQCPVTTDAIEPFLLDQAIDSVWAAASKVEAYCARRGATVAEGDRLAAANVALGVEAVEAALDRLDPGEGPVWRVAPLDY